DSGVAEKMHLHLIVSHGLVFELAAFDRREPHRLVLNDTGLIDEGVIRSGEPVERGGVVRAQRSGEVLDELPHRLLVRRNLIRPALRPTHGRNYEEKSSREKKFLH